MIFEALGERMSLRLSDFRDRLSFKDDLHYTALECMESLFPHIPDQERKKLRIDGIPNGQGVLEQTEISKCVWDRIPSDKPEINDKHPHLYTFFVETIVDGGIAFPGGVPVDKFPKDTRGHIPLQISFDLIAQDSQQNELYGFTFRGEGARPYPGISSVAPFSREEWPPHPCQPQAVPGEIKAGFEDRGSVSLEDKRIWDNDHHRVIIQKQRWEDRQYYLPAEKRLGKMTAPLCVICGQYISPELQCSEYLWSSDKTVRLEMRWWEGEKPSPSENWIKADFAARKIAHSIFIDRPEGDFQ